jgi:glyoxylase-like metal-dependent hydrolase (beta-lactamase superfamily II)
MRKNLAKTKSNFSIQSFEGGYDKNYSYLLSCLETISSIIVDASLELSRLQPFIKTRPAAILITHSHHDHIKYINEYIEKYPEIKVIGHPKSKLNNTSESNYLPMEDSSVFKLGGLEIKTIHTPGHYYDSVCYLVDNVIFTGDTLFIGRTGRTLSKGSNTSDLYNSVYKKLLNLPGNTIIYPGHNYGSKPTMTISENIKISNLLQASGEKDFIDRMKNYEKTRANNS